MIKIIIQKIKTRKIGKNAIIFYLPDEKKSRLRAFARTRAKKSIFWTTHLPPLVYIDIECPLIVSFIINTCTRPFFSPPIKERIFAQFTIKNDLYCALRDFKKNVVFIHEILSQNCIHIPFWGSNWRLNKRIIVC